MLAAKFSVIRVLLKDTKSKKHEKGLADIDLNKSEQQSIKECLQERLNGKMHVDQRCLQIYNCIGMSLLSLLCREEWSYRKWMLCVPFSRNMATD